MTKKTFKINKWCR